MVLSAKSRLGAALVAMFATIASSSCPVVDGALHTSAFAPGSFTVKRRPSSLMIPTNRPISTRASLYRKFHDYAWSKLVVSERETTESNQKSSSTATYDQIDTVPDEFKSNSSPFKGAPPGTNVVAMMRSISQFPFLEIISSGSDSSKQKNTHQVLRLARSAFLETQNSESQALISPMTIHVLNFVLFPNPHVRDRSGEYLGLPILGADIVSLPGNKHLVALDFQPVISIFGDEGSMNSLLPEQYSHFESKLRSIHSKYQGSDLDSAPLLSWGGDIPPQAKRYFSPFALWTRLSGDNAMDTVNTVIWDAFREYLDLYLKLMQSVQMDVNAGLLEVAEMGDDEDGNSIAFQGNPVWTGQLDYLEYRRTNDPARPMLQRLYGNEWAESVISEVLFPDP